MTYTVIPAHGRLAHRSTIQGHTKQPRFCPLWAAMQWRYLRNNAMPLSAENKNLTKPLWKKTWKATPAPRSRWQVSQGKGLKRLPIKGQRDSLSAAPEQPPLECGRNAFRKRFRNGKPQKFSKSNFIICKFDLNRPEVKTCLSNTHDRLVSIPLPGLRVCQASFECPDFSFGGLVSC